MRKSAAIAASSARSLAAVVAVAPEAQAAWTSASTAPRTRGSSRRLFPFRISASLLADFDVPDHAGVNLAVILEIASLAEGDDEFRARALQTGFEAAVVGADAVLRRAVDPVPLHAVTHLDADALRGVRPDRVGVAVDLDRLRCRRPAAGPTGLRAAASPTGVGRSAAPAARQYQHGTRAGQAHFPEIQIRASFSVVNRIRPTV